MSKSKNVPILGQPVFVIGEFPLEDRVTVVGERGLLNTLVYFAVEGIVVKQQRYIDEKMTKIVINEGMHAEGDETKTLELHLDLEKNFSRDSDVSTIFVDEAEAQAVARKANENQKRNCKKLLDLANKAYNEYDAIIALSSVK